MKLHDLSSYCFNLWVYSKVSLVLILPTTGIGQAELTVESAQTLHKIPGRILTNQVHFIR